VYAAPPPCGVAANQTSTLSSIVRDSDSCIAVLAPGTWTYSSTMSSSWKTCVLVTTAACPGVVILGTAMQGN
jgi:hypothetical protein